MAKAKTLNVDGIFKYIRYAYTLEAYFSMWKIP